MKSIVVIPTFNEKDNIATIVDAILGLKEDIKILFVDDASDDGTGNLLDELTMKYPDIKAIHLKKRSGLAKACIAGFILALNQKPDYILQMDADLQHDPAYITLLLEKIKTVDLVLGSRYLKKYKNKNISYIRKLISQAGNVYIKLITGMKFTDCLGGLRCFRVTTLKAINFSNIISDGFIFQAKILYYISKREFCIEEVPIIFQSRKTGLSKFSLKIILEALFKPLLFIHKNR